MRRYIPVRLKKRVAKIRAENIERYNKRVAAATYARGSWKYGNPANIGSQSGF